MNRFLDGAFATLLAAAGASLLGVVLVHAMGFGCPICWLLET